MSNTVINDMGFEMKDSPTSQQAKDEISKTKETTSSENTFKENNSAENTLETVAYVILVIGVIAAVIMLFTVCFIQNPEYHYHKELIFNPTGFAMTCGALLSSLAAWASMKVLANISRVLKAIKNK